MLVGAALSYEWTLSLYADIQDGSRFPHNRTMSQYDAILIPGGGVRDGGILPPWAAARFHRAVQRYQGEYLIPLSAGTVHRPPPRDEAGYPILEAYAEAKYLLEQGIPAERILPEASSYDTIGNAFFSRVIHVEPRAFRHLLVITSTFHMPRTEAIFRWVYGLAPGCFSLAFEEVPDAGIDADALAARWCRERESLGRLAGIMPGIATMRELHTWLFSQHRAYAVMPHASSTGEALDTY